MKKVIFFTVSVLLLINIYSGYKQITLKKQFEEANKFSEKLILRSNSLSDRLKMLIDHSYTAKINSDDSQVKNVFNGDKVVIYITEDNCFTCIQEILNYLDILTQSIGKDKIILMGNFKTRKSFSIFASEIIHHFGSMVYCNDAGFSEGMNQHPIVFVAKKDLSIQALFIPNLYPEFKEEYFTNILPSFF